jgi:hypothetical protein
MAIHFDFATGFNLPPYWINHPVNVLPEDVAIEEPEEAKVLSPAKDMQYEAAYLGNLYQDLVFIKHEDEKEWFSLPFDPVISVTGKNIVARRNVAKAAATGSERRGSVKELWSTDDYEINIAGSFIDDIGEDIPEGDLRRFRQYCEAKKPLLIESRLLSIFGIRRIAVVDYTLPFTKGIENQMYTIKAYSDDLFDLLIEN